MGKRDFDAAGVKRVLDSPQQFSLDFDALGFSEKLKPVGVYCQRPQQRDAYSRWEMTLLSINGTCLLEPLTGLAQTRRVTSMILKCRFHGSCLDGIAIHDFPGQSTGLRKEQK